MGIDLRLLPLDSRPPHMLGFSHTVLRVAQDYALFERIRALRPRSVPGELHINAFGSARVPDGYAKGEQMYGRLDDTDSYGEAYTWVTAAELVSAFDEYTDPDATVAYVRALEPDNLIILYWC